MSAFATDAPDGAADAWQSEFRRGIAACMPVLIGIIPFALMLGARAAQKGLSLVEVPLMTGLDFAGGSEFAAIQLWTSPPHIALIAAITFLVNSRHIVMGAALAPFLQHLPNRLVLPVLFVMCDESWALGLSDARRRASYGLSPAFCLPYYAGGATALFLMWVLFATLGAALGPVLGDVELYGFDMAFPAVFLVLLRGMWRGFRSSRPWFVSLGVAAFTHLFVSGAWFVAAGALSGVGAAYVLASDA